MRLIFPTIISLIFLTPSLIAQTSLINIMSIDPEIRDSIEKRTIVLNERQYGSINFRLFGNDSLVMEHHAFDVNSYAQNMTFLHGDTLQTAGYLNFVHLLFGYNVLYFTDTTCTISCVMVSELETLKLHQEDSMSQSLVVPCQTSRMILPRLPSFKKGETVYGLVHLVSADFYDVEEDQEIRYRLEITGYFKTEVF